MRDLPSHKTVRVGGYSHYLVGTHAGDVWWLTGRFAYRGRWAEVSTEEGKVAWVNSDGDFEFKKVPAPCAIIEQPVPRS